MNINMRGSSQSVSKKTLSNNYKNYSKQDVIWGWLLIAPTFLGLMVLNIYPAFRTMLLSFQEASAFGTTSFVGIDNYTRLLSDSEFWMALTNTLIYGLLQVPITIAFSLLFAVLLNSKIKGRGLIRTIYFLPMVAAPTAVAMVWRWLYNTDYGLINQFLSLIGFNGSIEWLTNPDLALYSIIIVGIWGSIGFNMILIISGLQEIPKELYEASIMDGANSFQKFFKITLPMLSPTLFFVLVTSTITAFQVFDLIFMMINLASPALRQTQSLVYLFYDYSFVLNQRGYGASIMVVLLIIIMIVTALQQIIQKKWVHYG